MKGEDDFLEKPCRKLGYCPYGALVEKYPLSMFKSRVRCNVFGHECPVYHEAEGFIDEEVVE